MAITTVAKVAEEDRKAQQNLLNGQTVGGKTHIEDRCQAASDPSESYIHSARWKIAYMGLFYGIISYVYRVNISIALPFMVKSTSSLTTSLYTSSTDNDSYIPHNFSTAVNVAMENNEMSLHDKCPQIGTSLSESLNAEFSWNKQAQSLVLSAFYYGYIFQFPFGWIAGKYGGKHIISVCMAISALLTLLTPVLARWNVYAVVTARVLLGLCSGATIASWYRLLSQWALPYERSRFIAMCWFGQITGTILGFFTSGFLCAHGFDNGWGSVFYVHGTVGMIFVLLWLYLVFDSPEIHPRISKEELKLLTSLSNGTNTDWKKKLSVPWKQMLTYRPVLVIFITHILECMVFYMILTCLPLYMEAVLRFDIQNNGMFSSLPFISGAVGLAISGILGDHIISKKWMSTTATRKLMQVVGHLGMAVFILIPGFLSCDQRMWVILCLCLCMWFDALGQGSGFACSPVDIAPRFASIIFGISNSFATIAGIVTPIIVGVLTKNDTAAEWKSVFCLASGSAVLGAFVFGIFSSSHLAPWASEQPIEMEVYREPSGTFVVKAIRTEEEQFETV